MIDVFNDFDGLGEFADLIGNSMDCEFRGSRSVMFRSSHDGITHALHADTYAGG
jgi:hypothetical protein